jgi:hypothetical protein
VRTADSKRGVQVHQLHPRDVFHLLAQTFPPWYGLVRGTFHDSSGRFRSSDAGGVLMMNVKLRSL